jgi:hypothetical protein
MEIFMKLELTDSAKNFISTLSKDDLKSTIITKDTFESNDLAIYEKFIEYIKIRLDAAGDRVRTITEQFRKEHPEYFE